MYRGADVIGGSVQQETRTPASAMTRLLGAITMLIVFLSSQVTLINSAFADQFKTPILTAIRPDWRAVQDQLKAEIASRPDAANLLTFTGIRRPMRDETRRWPAFIQLNAKTSQFFSAISQSPIPVLLPFDVAGFLTGATDIPAAHNEAGFHTEMFDAGPAGYDAVFSLATNDAEDMPPRTYAKPVEVHITGSMLVYDINDPLAGKGTPVKSLAAQFPDVRRVIREGFVRYAFTRFGVPYVVSIQCLDSSPKRNRLACREASAVAERFLTALRVSGGKPQRALGELASEEIDRPASVSPDFTYRPPGDIISNSGYHGQPGHPDLIAYAQIRFPLLSAPAYANSQSFLNWGDCNFTGRTVSPHTKGAAYRCKRNDKPLVFDESATENYSYPWQDNFCETRSFEVGQCANGFGHQGQDIRPSTCPLRNDGADRCDANHYPIVAVRDGIIVRDSSEQAVFVVLNSPTEHVRFRYLHLNPAHMNADGILNGRRVSEGEKIGVVSNFQDYPGGTTSHLHFDIQVFTRDGWLWVNPYVTLISAYERLLNARGTEIAPEPAAPAPVAGAVSDDQAKATTPPSTSNQ
jgi:murein DD-endopeptidase MepM/ murein hydrolase activator NlpD